MKNGGSFHSYVKLPEGNFGALKSTPMPSSVLNMGVSNVGSTNIKKPVPNVEPFWISYRPSWVGGMPPNQLHKPQWDVLNCGLDFATTYPWLDFKVGCNQTEAPTSTYSLIRAWMSYWAGSMPTTAILAAWGPATKTALHHILENSAISKWSKVYKFNPQHRLKHP